MHSIPSHANPNDTFWLARHAHNVLAPLIEAARQYEPSIHYTLILGFDTEKSFRHAGSFLDIIAHWGRTGMFLYDTNLTTKERVARVAAKVQAFIDTEQAALEAKHDSEVLYVIEQADDAEALDWEFQQERIAERADIEVEAA